MFLESLEPFNPYCCDSEFDLTIYNDYVFIEKNIILELNDKIFNKTYYAELALPSALQRLNWVIYEADLEYIVNPYMLVLFNRLIHTNFTPQEFFGKEFLDKMEIIYGKEGDDIYNYKEISYLSSTIIDDDYFDLREQQHFLRYQVHLINSTPQCNSLLICSRPIPHYQAQFLTNYHNHGYLYNIRDRSKNIQFGFDYDNIRLMFDQKFIDTQNKLRNEFMGAKY